MLKRLFIACVALAIVATPAFAAGGNKGGDKGGGGAQVAISFATESGAHLAASPTRGSEVWFAVDPLRVKDRDLGHLWVTNICSQNGAPVSVQDAGVEYEAYRQGLAGAFTLASTSWADGAADCVAYVWMWPDGGAPLSGGMLTYSVGA